MNQKNANIGVFLRKQLFLSKMSARVALKDVQEASKRIAPYIHRTPIMTCSTLDNMAGKSLYFKCEMFQKVGAFKVSKVGAFTVFETSRSVTVSFSSAISQLQLLSFAPASGQCRLEI